MTIKEFWESKESIAIHCDTEEKANKLLRKFYKLGKKWSSGKSYLKEKCWEIHKKQTCYSNKQCYGSTDIFKKIGYIIIEFEDLEDFKNVFTKDDLKNRMVVECRNGERFMIVDDSLIGIDGFFQKGSLDNDFNCLYPDAKEWDIVKIFEQQDTFELGFNEHLQKNNNLIWERKEEILTKEEKEYLANVIKPVREKVECISKNGYERNFISIKIKNEDLYEDCIVLYFFEKGTQFVGMETEKEYSLEELGL